MINQGEKIQFRGTFKQKVGEEWIDIPNLALYIIKAKITNPTKNITINLSSSTSGILIESDKKTYYFNILPKQSATMEGECYCEIALIDSNGDIILSNNKATFVITQSSLGRELANI